MSSTQTERTDGVSAPPEIPVSAVASINDVAAAASEMEGPRDRVVLSNGVVLKTRAVPPLALREVAVRVPEPKIPTVFIEAKGRAEENPNDPDYLAAMQMYQQEQVFRIADVLMLLGTSVEEVPETIQRPEANDWLDELEAVGIPVDGSNRHKRYLSWLRFYAIPSEGDIARIVASVLAWSGVTEVDVARAAKAFRGDPPR